MQVGAIFFYIFSSLFLRNFIVVFVCTLVLIATDFWVTKNITGRYLVGLRYWDEPSEDGTSNWRFEAIKEVGNNNNNNNNNGSSNNNNNNNNNNLPVLSLFSVIKI